MSDTDAPITEEPLAEHLEDTQQEAVTEGEVDQQPQTEPTTDVKPEPKPDRETYWGTGRRKS